jgi:hypothetical protein
MMTIIEQVAKNNNMCIAYYHPKCKDGKCRKDISICRAATWERVKKAISTDSLLVEKYK